MLVVAATNVITYSLASTKYNHLLTSARSEAHAANQALNQALRDATESVDSQQREQKAVLDFVCRRILATARPAYEEGGLGTDTTIRMALQAADQQISDACWRQPLVEASVRTFMGHTFQNLGRLEQAISEHRLACQLRVDSLGSDHSTTLASRTNLAMAYLAARQSYRAIPILKDTLQRLQSSLGPDHADTLYGMSHLAAAYLQAQRIDEAVPVYEEVLKLSRQVLGPDDPNTLKTLFNLGMTKLVTKHPEEANSTFQELVSLTRENPSADQRQLATLLGNVAMIMVRSKQYATAEAYLRESLRIREESPARSWIRFDTQRRLGSVLLSQGIDLLPTNRHQADLKFAEAEPLLRSGYLGMKEREGTIPYTARGRMKSALKALIVLCTRTDKTAEAAKWRRILETTSLFEARDHRMI